MIKRFILLVFALFLFSCSTNKPVVRTTKTVHTKPRTTVATKPRTTPTSTTATKTSPVQTTKPVVAKTTEKPQETNNTRDNQTVILEATTKVKVTTEMVLAYIEKYKSVAKENMIKSGIPASITLGQAILESGAGTGPLSVQANNHFGIKCHKEWTGPSISHDDDESGECFRKYDDPSLSFRDHSFFLTSRPRYAELFKLEKDDYKSWAKGLKMAGYATDPKYPDKLIGLIERYGLQRFDAEVLGKEFVPVAKTEPIAYSEVSEKYVVTKGDTLYSISKKFNISIEDLKKKNNLVDNSLSLGQTIIVK